MSIAVVTAGLVAGLASTPHCAAMCGPLAAAACRGPGLARRAGRYHLGRALGYAGLGAISGTVGAGALGAAAWLGSAWPGAVVAWTVAAALVVSAVRLWRRSSTTSRDDPQRAPLIALGRPTGLRARLRALLPRGPLALGLVTALLPCGALAAAILIAAAAGGPVGGALAMTSFAAASAGGLLVVGGLAGRLARARGAWPRVVAVGLALGAVVVAWRPLPTLLAGPGEVPACHRSAP